MSLKRKKKKHPIFLFPCQLYFLIKVCVSIFEYIIYIHIYIKYKWDKERQFLYTHISHAYFPYFFFLSFFLFFLPILLSLTCITFLCAFQSSWIPVGWRFTWGKETSMTQASVTLTLQQMPSAFSPSNKQRDFERGANRSPVQPHNMLSSYWVKHIFHLLIALMTLNED